MTVCACHRRPRSTGQRVSDQSLDCPPRVAQTCHHGRVEAWQRRARSELGVYQGCITGVPEAVQGCTKDMSEAFRGRSEARRDYR